MEITIEEGCIACGLCINSCPDVFRMSDKGVAEQYRAPSQVDEPVVLEAAENCPVSVITVNL